MREGIFHAIHRYAKANNKYMKDYDKNKESSSPKCWDVNNMVRQLSQMLRVNSFELIKRTS